MRRAAKTEIAISTTSSFRRPLPAGTLTVRASLKNGASFAQPMPLDMRVDPRIRRSAADLVAQATVGINHVGGGANSADITVYYLDGTSETITTSGEGPYTVGGNGLIDYVEIHNVSGDIRVSSLSASFLDQQGSQDLNFLVSGTDADLDPVSDVPLNITINNPDADKALSIQDDASSSRESGDSVREIMATPADDTLVGSDGPDVFVWHLADRGTDTMQDELDASNATRVSPSSSTRQRA